jgi:hypothetical protein
VSKEEGKSVRLKANLIFGKSVFRAGAIVPLERVPETFRAFVTDDLSEAGESVKPGSVDTDEQRPPPPHSRRK